MSATSTPNDSPVGTPIQPMHNPAQAAHVVVPQAPLGNTTNGQYSQIPGMGAKALLAKKFAKSQCAHFSRRRASSPQIVVDTAPDALVFVLATRPSCHRRTTC